MKPELHELHEQIQPLFHLLECRFPGSRWDLLQQRRKGKPTFTMGRLVCVHPDLSRLDESKTSPPLVLELPEQVSQGGQLHLALDLPPADLVDFLWPIGPVGSGLWACGRMRKQQAVGLRRNREWLGGLLGEFARAESRAAGAQDGTSVLGSAVAILHHADSPIVDILDQVRRVALTDNPVHIQGESGVGKELFARALHQLSPRRGGSFVAQNGASIAETLIESELFGHSRGSFTGAQGERVGLLELSSGGSFFLDEVGDLSPSLQVRLLRVIQERVVRRVGENKLRPVDFRLITATHQDMAACVREGRFRHDLWYRIQGFVMRIPPLRERRMDIPILARHFLKEQSRLYSLALNSISEGALDAMRQYPWPGNVRELQNEVGRVSALHGGKRRLERWMLSENIFRDADLELPSSAAPLSLQEAQVDLEKRMIRHTLKRFGGNRSRSARALGLSRQGLLKKLKRLELERVAL